MPECSVFGFGVCNVSYMELIGLPNVSVVDYIIFYDGCVATLSNAEWMKMLAFKMALRRRAAE